MKFIKEFKEFAVKGNVIDLAVAVIIGGAFGKIVSSLVADIVMPIIGVIIGGVDFTNFKIILRKTFLETDGVTVAPEIVLNIGIFIQNIFDFLIIAAAIFFMVKIISKIKNRLIKEEVAAKEEAISVPTEEQKLLTEIRDLLKNR